MHELNFIIMEDAWRFWERFCCSYFRKKNRLMSFFVFQCDTHSACSSSNWVTDTLLQQFEGKQDSNCADGPVWSFAKSPVPVRTHPFVARRHVYQYLTSILLCTRNLEFNGMRTLNLTFFKRFPMGCRIDLVSGNTMICRPAQYSVTYDTYTSSYEQCTVRIWQLSNFKLRKRDLH